jgi:FemAB-related protein (PEP-CTERM system-associated)
VIIRAADLADPRDSAAIATFVADHPGGRIFHRPQWGRAVERGCSARARYLIAESKTGEIAGLLPLSEIRSRLFGNSLVSTGFGVGGGILAADPEAIEALGRAAWSLAGQCGCASVELRGGPVPEGWAVKDGVYAEFAAELPRDDEKILLSIKKRQRAEVRRAQDHGLEYREGELGAHYAAYSASVRNHGTPVFPRALFEAMADEFGADCHILTAWKDGRPLSSLFSFFDKGIAMPFWGGGTAGARQWRANEALYYELMRRAARRGCARIDFGRSKIGTGPYAFKKNWGLEPRPLAYAVRTAEGAKAREVNPLAPRYRLRVAAWRKMPLWLANRLGPPIARGLG